MQTISVYFGLHIILVLYKSHLLIMRRGSNAKDGQKKKKKPVTNQEKAVFFVDKLQDTIASQIEKGTLQISKSKRHIQPSQNKADLSLHNIEQNLSLIRASIIQQKKQQQQLDKAKLAQAKEFVTKMKKDKEQHKLKMRESEQKREMVYAKIFSDSAMEIMRRKLEERVELKKKEIEGRIKEMETKRHQREKTTNGQQIQYSQFVKGLKQKSKSSTKLPSISNPETVERNISVLMMRGERKNSLSSIKKELFSNKPSKNMDLLMEKQKVKFENSRLKYFQLGNQQLLKRMKSNHESSINKIEKSNSEKRTSFLGNKSKIYGDQYLKESLLKIKKQSEPETVQESTPLDIKPRLQVQSHEAQINKNNRLQHLKENWLKVLSRIEHLEITEQQGIDLLHGIEKKLDKIDSKGITQRLKKKLQIFAKLHPINPQPQKEQQLLV